MKVTIAVMVVISSSAFSQFISLGKCPDVQPVQNFNASAYLGKWYEAERYFAIFEVGTKCSSATYSLNSNGSLNVSNQAVSELSGNTQEISGIAILVKSGLGQLEVYFRLLNLFTTGANYYVLGTDYNNYATVFSCKDLGFNLHARFAWLLTRSKNATNDIISTAKKALIAQNISTDPLLKISQDC